MKLKYIVNNLTKYETLKQVLKEEFSISERLIIKLKNSKQIYLNNEFTHINQKLQVGDTICVDLDFEETCDKIVSTREKTKLALKELGFDFPDSKTNFLFISHKEVPAKEIFEALRKENIFVRYFNKPRIDNYLRVTIGTEEEMEALIAFLKGFLH